jgi:hypothetical protein
MLRKQVQKAPLSPKNAFRFVDRDHPVTAKILELLACAARPLDREGVNVTIFT